MEGLAPRLFLLALAIVVIAVFCTQHLAIEAVAVAFGLLGLIIAMKRVGVLSVNVYVGALFWAAVWQSGVHATIAGVVLGVVTPLRPYFSNTTFAASADTLLYHFREALSQEDSGMQDSPYWG